MSDGLRERVAGVLRAYAWDAVAAAEDGAEEIPSAQPYVDRLLSLMEGEPVVETLYYSRCGWCGAYEGTVNPGEPCARDSDTGEYIGPHQFGPLERVAIPLYAAPPVVTDWQPIETAPKDETHVLAWFHDDAPERRHWGRYQSGVSIAYWTAHNGGGWVSNRFGEPTHWMPLPAPPIAKDPEEPARAEETTT